MAWLSHSTASPAPWPTCHRLFGCIRGGDGARSWASGLRGVCSLHSLAHTRPSHRLPARSGMSTSFWAAGCYVSCRSVPRRRMCTMDHNSSNAVTQDAAWRPCPPPRGLHWSPAVQQSSSPAVIPVQSLTHLPRSSLLAAHHSLELRRFVRRCMERAQSGASTGTSDFFEGTPPLVCEADVKQQARKRLRALRCSWLNRLVGALQQLSSFLQQHGWRASCEVRRRAHLCSERCLPRSSTLACCLRTQKASGSVTPRGRRVVCVTSGCVPAGTDFVDALAPSLPAGALTRSSNAEALRHARAAAQRHHRATRTALCALPRQFQRRNTRRSLDRVRRRMMDVTLTPYDSRQQLC